MTEENKNPLAVVEGEVIPPEPKKKLTYRTIAQRRQEIVDRTKLPNGLTKMEEKFCLNYVKYGALNSVKAYLEAGYKDPGGNWAPRKVKKLLSKEHIKKRIAEIEENKEEQLIDLTKDQYVHKCLKLHDDAKEGGDFKAAKDALELVGRTLGFVIDKKVTVGAQITAKQDLSPEERMEKIKKLAGIVGMKV